MHLNFTSKITSYNEAIDSEIIQVSFEEYENEDAFNQTALYLLLSISYEFPPFEPNIEWFDGEKFDGGAKALNYVLGRESIQLWLDNGISFDIKHKADKKTYSKIKQFLARNLTN